MDWISETLLLEVYPTKVLKHYGEAHWEQCVSAQYMPASKLIPRSKAASMSI